MAKTAYAAAYIRVNMPFGIRYQDPLLTVQQAWDVAAYMIAKPYWRRGLGGEAARALVRYGFEVLRLPRLIALIDPEHEASIRTAESAGLMRGRETIMDGLPTIIFERSNAD